MKTLHVVGYKNSGKTTLLERWIRVAKSHGRSVAMLKHHGHGGPIDVSPDQTDTNRFWQAGSEATLVAGGGMTQLLLNEEPTFDELKRLAAYREPDMLLIEGYKDKPGSKVVLVRSVEDWDTLHTLTDIELVVGDVAWEGTVIADRSCTEELDRWFINWLNEEENHETV